MKRGKWFLVGAVVSACLAMAISTMAQTAAPAAPKGAATVATGAPEGQDQPKFESKMTLMQLWVVGGWCMWPLGATNIVAVAFIIYAALIVRENKMLVPNLLPSIQESLDKLQIEEAMTICERTPSMLTNVLHAGLERISDGVLDTASMEKAMEEASVEETSAGMRILGFISISAQIAPMLGLLGTVSGMIKAFEKIGRGAMGKPELLANDIGEALITTAYGLIVGIPAMMGFFYLKSRYTSNITRMGRVLGNMSHRLVAAGRRAAEGGAPAEPAAAEADAAAAPAAQ
jgi:biopolymer transport protein ExbB